MKRLCEEYSPIDGHEIIKKEVNIYKSHAHLQPPLPAHLNLLQQQHKAGAVDPHLPHSIKDSHSSAESSVLTLPGLTGGAMQSSLYPSVTYATVSTGTTSAATPSTSHVTTTKSQGLQMGLSTGGHTQMRIKGNSSPGGTLPQPQMLPQQHSPSNNSQFQRLKVEDALTYLDMVKFKFGEKPQVYNDFLDIMKEFKTQSIDTPGVITRVSSLFNGYPELIMGFNTFLPPGYKIEVQKSDQGYAFQVSVSVPSPTGGSVNDPSALAMNTSGGITGNAGYKGSTILSGTGIIHNNVSRTSGPPPPSQQSAMPVSSSTSHLMSSSMDMNSGSGLGGATIAPSQVTAASVASVLHHPSSVGNTTGDFFGSCGPHQPPSSQQAQHPSQQQQHLQQHLQQQQQQQQQHQMNTSHNNALSLTAAALQTQMDTPQNQPVEFNHAINYVNKIKNRFQGQPEKYKRFLEILHAYQKEQRTLKEASQGSGLGKHLTEQEVYSQVAKLFENQSDLLAEFGQFLPDATNHMSNQSGITGAGVPLLITDQQYQSSIGKKTLSSKPHHHRAGGGGVNVIGGTVGSGSAGGGGNTGNTGNAAVFMSGDRDREHNHHSLHSSNHGHHHISDRHISNKTGHITNPKRSPPLLGYNRDMPPAKKHKPSFGTSSLCRDFSIADAAKYATLNDYAFFDKLRKAVKSQDVYNNFLRCLVLFNQEIVSKYELVQLVTPFLGKFPELMRWFRDFLGQSDTETLPFNTVRQERPHNEHALDIDYSTAKRLGASYCIIPPAQENLKFSGRTKLCNEVLNNQWVSFPTWSEDSSFVGSRKNQYEEYMYRCEDERFELDVVIETNASTIRSLEGVSKKLNRMSPEEINKYHFEDNLSGNFHILHHKALKRIYGDKAPDIIEGLKRNPAVAVPVVLRRLKYKEEEWRDAQKGFNKIWREQNEKYYLKSLDYQGINFKQNDVKILRSKSLLNDIETLFEERNEQNEDRVPTEQMQGPHLTFTYRDRSILDDAANLLIHHVKRQTGIQKIEKRRIKHILRQFVPDLFFHPRQQLSEDDRDEDDDKEDGNESPCSNSSKEESNKLMKELGSPLASKSPNRADSSSGCADSGDDKQNSNFPNIKDEDLRVPLHAQCPYPDESYTLFMANNNWYLFLRLHATLCDRLVKIYDRAVIIAQDERLQRNTRKESTAVALRLKPKPTIEVEEYYPAFLDMVKNLLDGNMESNTFEDTLREMFGIHAYIAFTLDKVVSYAVRQLQHCVTERNATACTNTFLKEQKRGATGGLCITGHRRVHSELQYLRTVERILQEDNCFKIYIYKRDGRMTIEMIDSEPEDLKKVDDQRKWSKFKDKFPNIPNRHAKPLLPLYLNRNICKLRKTRTQLDKLEPDKGFSLDLNKKSSKSNIDDDGDDEDDDADSNEHSTNRTPPSEGRDDVSKSCDRKLSDRLPPERAITKITCYDVSDDTECALTDSKILFTTNKDSYLYKRSAFIRAKQTHAAITKRLAIRFRAWLRCWQQKHVSESQTKQCTDWLMGTGPDFVPNKTWIQTDNDLTKTPYIPYNRYRVRLLSTHHHATAPAIPTVVPTLAVPTVGNASTTINNGSVAHDDSTNSSTDQQRDVT